ncbi:hypothetical protein [Aurantiacibacter spongiae]|uniref:Uncharacterized protein n=1 Tax=Aurantiacibacter spongiae TaxID=2488860 RepID=A0A3N5DA24_9SPHN|nr:hypothetical protein [Aurantiacibacter spongiae]RPF71498.1 hypothetical protein EG799_07630 [Aurantiacibacter spongiae]
MRPDSIRKFDMFYILSILTGLAKTLLNLGTMRATLEAELARSGLGGMGSTGEATLYASLAFGFLLSVVLWWLVSRKRLGFVKWIMLAILVYNVVTIPLALIAGVGSVSITGLVTIIFQAVALWFLFQPDAREWLATRGR